MFTFIYEFLGGIIRFFMSLTGDFTIALLLFTLIMQVVLLPLGIKQQKNSVKQASLAPKIMAIRKKYAGRNDQATQQKMQQETLDLYQKENFNPAGGCLPLLIQLPIIMLLYTVVREPLSYILGYSAESIEAIKGILEAAGYTIADEMSIAHNMIELGQSAFADLGLKIFPSEFSLFGMDLTLVPMAKDAEGALLDAWLLLIPAVTFVAMYGSQLIIRKFTYQSPEVKAQQNSCSMKIMTFTMPLMSVYLAATLPATLGLYWIFRNIFTTVQQIVLSKAIPVPQFTEEDFKAAERELAGKSKKKGEKKELDPNRPKVRSLHYIDAEDDEPYAVLPEKKEVEETGADETVTETETKEEKEEKKDADTFGTSVVAPAPLKDDSDKPTK